MSYLSICQFATPWRHRFDHHWHKASGQIHPPPHTLINVGKSPTGPYGLRLGQYVNVFYCVCVCVWMRACTAWCNEIGSRTSPGACNSGASSDVEEPNSLHQAVQAGLKETDGDSETERWGGGGTRHHWPCYKEGAHACYFGFNLPLRPDFFLDLPWASNNQTIALSWRWVRHSDSRLQGRSEVKMDTLAATRNSGTSEKVKTDITVSRFQLTILLKTR